MRDVPAIGGEQGRPRTRLESCIRDNAVLSAEAADPASFTRREFEGLPEQPGS